MRPRLPANSKDQPGLWPFGISGDYPILLCADTTRQRPNCCRNCCGPHLLASARLNIDLVILNRQMTNYGQPLQNYIHRLLARTEQR